MLCRGIYYIAQRTICENTRMLHTFGMLSRFDSQQCNSCVNSPYFQRNLNLIISKRFKSKSRTVKHESDSEDDEDSMEIDDYLHTKHSKIVKTTLSSLRLDCVAKAGFGISRNKIDKEFYNSNIRVNGERFLKKSLPVEVEDEIDLITGRSPNNPNFLIVHRCTLLSAKSNSEGISVQLCRNKSLLIEDYKDPWKGIKDN